MGKIQIDISLPDILINGTFLNIDRCHSEQVLTELKEIVKLDNKFRLELIDRLIVKMNKIDQQEISVTAMNNAVFDNYFFIRRVQSQSIGSPIKSILLVYRNILFDAIQNGTNLQGIEWEKLMETLPILTEKTYSYLVAKLPVSKKELCVS